MNALPIDPKYKRTECPPRVKSVASIDTRRLSAWLSGHWPSNGHNFRFARPYRPFEIFSVLPQSCRCFRLNNCFQWAKCGHSLFRASRLLCLRRRMQALCRDIGNDIEKIENAQGRSAGAIFTSRPHFKCSSIAAFASSGELSRIAVTTRSCCSTFMASRSG